MASSTVPAGGSGGSLSALVNYQTTPEHYLTFTPNAPYYYATQTMNITAGLYKVYPEYATTNATVTGRAQRAKLGYSRTREGITYGATAGTNLGSVAVEPLILTATSTVDLFWVTTSTTQGTFGATNNSSIGNNFYFANGFFFIRNNPTGICWYATANNTGAAPVAGGSTPATFYSAAFGNGNYVAGMSGPTNSFAYTNNIAGNWTNVSVAGMSGTVYAIAFATSITLFAAAADQQIYTSTNGVAWTLRLTGSTSFNQIWAPRTGTIKFIASGGAGAGSLYTSTDGISWTARSMTSTETVFGICQWGTYYHALTFYTTSGTDIAKTQYSTDTITWTLGGITGLNATRRYYFAPNYMFANPLYLCAYTAQDSNGAAVSAFYSQTIAITSEFNFYVGNRIAQQESTIGHDGAYQMYFASAGNNSTTANNYFTNFFNTATIGGQTGFYFYKIASSGTLNN